MTSLVIRLISLLIIHCLYPSPDRNGYPAAYAGEAWREEYEWIAGNSSSYKNKKSQSEPWDFDMV
ncbi:hypothetical protein BBH99_01505 [Chryseobacterium contaminans]|uniref:Uncharacterized protein n=1 Tax=Chryseobacterium contaminans TaxID=1423959 RepID=A0ABX2X5B5_9FLAO|nr:hypothetical protein BBH99_01505 [Chryseobacterium contaminans]